MVRYIAPAPAYSEIGKWSVSHGLYTENVLEMKSTLCDVTVKVILIEKEIIWDQ